MKLTTTVLLSAALFIFVVIMELAVGVRWSLSSHDLPDRDLKPMRPVARFAFTGVVVTTTILLGGAWIRVVANHGE